jgi:hypothetical protein
MCFGDFNWVRHGQKRFVGVPGYIDTAAAKLEPAVFVQTPRRRLTPAVRSAQCLPGASPGRYADS